VLYSPSNSYEDFTDEEKYKESIECENGNPV